MSWQRQTPTELAREMLEKAEAYANHSPTEFDLGYAAALERYAQKVVNLEETDPRSTEK